MSTELRLLANADTKPHCGFRPPSYRWVLEANGHPGKCAEDCWHFSPEDALVCFHGEALEKAS